MTLTNVFPEDRRRAVAVIPARGGSKRLPRKNVAEINGRPMVAWSVAAALDSGCFERVIVSTDDPEAARVARDTGAEVFERTIDLAGDTARVVDVCLSLLNQLEAEGALPDVLACLYPTAPLRRPADVRAVTDLIRRGDADYAMAVTTFDLPAHQALRLGEDGTLTSMWPDLVERRETDIGPLVVDNGSTYAVHVPAFRASPSFYGAPLRGHIMPRLRSIDVNTAEDLTMLRLVAAHIDQLEDTQS